MWRSTVFRNREGRPRDEVLRPGGCGQRDGIVGFGIGKAAEVPDAIRKGIEDAKSTSPASPCGVPPFPTTLWASLAPAASILKPAAPGTGVIAGGPVRAVVECAGIRDIRAKALRSNNPCNVVRATLAGLTQLRTAEEVAALRGKSAKEIL